MHAVILAGGKGTRLRPLTDTRPKPLLPFVGDPFAAGLLRRLGAVGCTGATFLVGHDARPFAPLEPLGDALGITVRVVTEPEPLDTAGAARDLITAAGDGPFLVCNGDILTDLDYASLVAAHTAAGAIATLALTHVEDTSAYGVVALGPDSQVRSFIEKPAPGTVDDDTVNAGTYVLEASAFDGCPSTGTLSFERAVFPQLLDRGATVLGVPDDAFWLDLGTPQRYLAGHRAVLQGVCDWPLGSEFTRTGSVLLHRDAQIAPDATLGECVAVGARARIDAGAAVQNSAIFEDVHVRQGASITDAIVGEGSSVGPGATLADTVVAPHAA